MNISTQPPTMLVIGYGNALRGDDGAGWLAAEALLAAGQPAYVQIMLCHQLTLDLASDLAAVDQVLFIDARLGAYPGKIERMTLQPDHSAFSPLEHHIKPEVLLAACEALYKRTPHAILLTVQSQSFDYHTPLSNALKGVWQDFLYIAQQCILHPSIDDSLSLSSDSA